MERDKRVCWVEFIRAAPHTERPLKKTKTDKGKSGLCPIPAFMSVLDSKLGPVFDKLVLQVCGHNKHAQERFAQYGFVRDELYDDETRIGRGPKIRLLGMVKEPQGKALKVAQKRRETEAVEKQHQQAMRTEKPKDVSEEPERRQPRRAASRDVVYEEPEDPGITADDIVMVCAR